MNLVVSVSDLDKCLEDIARQAIVLMDKNGIKHSDFSDLDRLNKELLDINENDKDSDRSRKIKANEKNKIINNILLEYFSIFGKLICPQKRIVLYSRELKDKIDRNAFTKKDDSIVSIEEAKEIKDAILYFEKLIQNGSNLNNHLSRGIYNTKQPDTLLYVWNVKHIHLNKQEATSKADMQNNRADWLLFVIVDDEECIFIDVRPHPHGSGFLSYSILKIIHNNAWMEKAGFFAVKQIGAEYVVKDTETLYKLYKNNVNISLGPFEFNGTVYVTKGGITTAGTSVSDTFKFLQWKRLLQKGFENIAYDSYLPSEKSLGEGIIIFQDSSRLPLIELIEKNKRRC